MKHVTIDSIKNNSKYKIIHDGEKHYVIDLNRNKLTYIFPLLNYLLPHRLMEISDDAYFSLTTVQQSVESKVKNMMITLIGIVILFIYYRANVVDNFFLKHYPPLIIIALMVLIFIIKWLIDKRKRKRLNIEQIETEKRAYIFPEIFTMVISIILYVIAVVSFVFLSFKIFGSMGEPRLNSNVLIIMLAIILSFDQLLYSNSETSGKMSHIKVKA
ncbi:DUF443 family protein [Staphylococcus lugdunensis]|uniref:DUF443 family protein n=1 Tax=Staphylococcus TaxID=1279 RepID=UPI0008A27ECF|nr:MULTISPECIES: DUF443 family protein [Staphylococcus]ARJ13279.1 hypothetical protein B7468_02785 [Staphylococcus lugdunensis]MCH8665455.1 DUF443 family protein [Staphylococcus lugdunensis]OFJ66365.1 hypothetical protein HMPREF2855_02900 [Staphylococcus sp. HMSC077E11]OFM43150.1 hypothetical protein HMPREF2688_05195 [Staphylococcus sp. HMSC077E12]OFR86844.1 hypothetical protein HMPREF2864_02795 [Staphylococcus sp. HMSC059F04]